MNFEKQLEQLKGLLFSNSSDNSSLWKLEHNGRKGLFLTEQNSIKLEDAEDFLNVFGDNSKLLKTISPELVEEELEIPFSLPLGDLTLTSFSFYKTWSGDDYELEMTIEWPHDFNPTIEILEDLDITFFLEGLHADINLTRSCKGGNQEETDIVISAKMHFNGATFDINIELPSLIFSASLDQSDEDSHESLIHDFLPHDNSNKEIEAKLEALDLTIALLPRRVLFHFTVSNLLNLKHFTLGELEVDIFYNGYAPHKISGSLWGDLEIKIRESETPLKMSFLAELDAEEAWQLAAQTGQQELSIGDLIDGIKRLFPDDSDHSLPELPEVISNTAFSSLGLNYNTASHAFTFEAVVSLHLSDHDEGLDMHLHFEVDSEHKKTLKSHISLFGQKFELDYFSDNGDEDKEPLMSFLAEYSGSLVLSLQDVVSAITSSNDNTEDLVPSLSIDLTQVRIAYVKEGDQSAKLVGIVLDSTLTLENLPLVGSVLKDIGLENVQILYATKDINDRQATAINGLLPKNNKLPEPSISSSPTEDGESIALHKGLNFAAQLKLGIEPFSIVAGNGEEEAPKDEQDLGHSAQSDEQSPTIVPPPADNTMWYDLQKKIGPLSLKKVGARYSKERLWLLLSADLSMSSFTIGLQGLGIGFKVGDWGDIKPTLSGLSLSYQAGPVEISGAFEKSNKEYLGAASIKTASFSLSAFGGYGKSDGETTLFIFAMLKEPPLGGPSYFYVTGIAAGFGYNRDIRIPSLDEMTKFPLISAMLPEAKGALELKPDAKKPMETLDKISEGGWLPKASGQNWLAIGVRFTSFEMVQSFALATVKFGTRFEVDILGLSQLTIPAPDPESDTNPSPIAYAEVALRAILIPEEGILKVDGKMTPASFILVKEARLTGGFAFYLWFDGDFVISFGGYHPDFDQGHYPDVPRLGIDFHIGSNLHITAKAYFALTPSAVMAGGKLNAIYHAGPLKAWFNAGADFLLQWKPFHYEAKVYVHIGASFTLNFAFFSLSITVELGADLTLWGPPLGGTAHISYSIASFTIDFGAGKPDPDPLTWSEFRDQFLPVGKVDSNESSVKNGALLNARVSEGLVKDLTQDSKKAHKIAWVINSAEVNIELSTSVPATILILNDRDLIIPENHYDDKLHIGPMREYGEDYSAPYNVRVEYFNHAYNNDNDKWSLYDDVNAEAILGKAPKALWSDYKPLGQKKPLSQANSSINDTLMGMRIYPINTEPDETNSYNLKDLLFEEHEIEKVSMFEMATTFDTQSLETKADVSTIRNNDNRDEILESLKAMGIIKKTFSIELMHLGENMGALNTQPIRRIFNPIKGE